jgi:hypothetical protein
LTFVIATGVAMYLDKINLITGVFFIITFTWLLLITVMVSKLYEMFIILASAFKQEIESKDVTKN